MHASISTPLNGQNVLIASTLAAHSKDDQQEEVYKSDNSRDSISGQVKLLAQALDRGTCKLIRLLPAFDKHRAWANDGQRSCVSWLNTYCGMSLSAAHDRCRVAYALEKLPIITRLFMLGELSWSKVRALTRIATPENEQELAAQALLMSASAIEQLARQYRDVGNADKLEKDNERASKQYEDRRVHYRYDEQGMVSIHASLPPLEGAAVLKSLARAEDEIFNDRHGPTSEHLQSDDQNISNKEDPTQVNSSQLKADALCLMAAKHLSVESVDIRTADRYQVVVHVDAETLSHGVNASGQKPSVCHIENGPSIASNTARRIADDCSITPIYMHHGEPLSIGRKSRIWTSAITRAIVARDQHCQFPGCSCSRHTHIHHLKHWAQGGETSVDNGVLLCGFHHRLVHEENYSIEKTVLDSAGRLPERVVTVENGQGGSFTLKAKQFRFRVRRANGGFV